MKIILILIPSQVFFVILFIRLMYYVCDSQARKNKIKNITVYFLKVSKFDVNITLKCPFFLIESFYKYFCNSCFVAHLVRNFCIILLMKKTK